MVCTIFITCTKEKLNLLFATQWHYFRLVTLYLMILLVAQTMQHQVIGCLIGNELGTIWKKAVIVAFTHIHSKSSLPVF